MNKPAKKKESFPIFVLKKVLHIPVRFPYYVQIDVSNVCNLKCGMCPINFVEQEKKLIDFDIFIKIIDRIEGAEEVALVGLGEPLMHPKIFDAIRYSKDRGLVVKITTNGLLLDSDSKIENLILSGLDSITFSVEGVNCNSKEINGHYDHDVFKNIERTMFIKKELGSKTPKISLQSVFFKNREKDLYDLIEWGAAHNVHRVNVLRMCLYFDTGLQRPSRDDEKAVFKEFAKLRKKYRIRIDSLQDQFYTGLKGLLYKHFKYFLRLDSCCTRLLDYPLISQNGDMIPCCVLPHYKFGNILEKSISEVWYGEEFNHFRKNHNKVEICSKCDNWRIKMFDIKQ